MKKRILIIDDDPLLNKINEKVLLAAGFVNEVHIALNGLQALEYLNSRISKNYPLPDLIILDLHMPVMDGFEFLDRYNEMQFSGKCNINLVVFTGSSSIRDRKKAEERGITHFLNKPYLLRGLKDIVMRMSNPVRVTA